ncbi:conserved membrane hypothetical protein [Verrucomicrobia bacterium]|nr:conserved membrane hypothetical protein [Verrucomicrobiota bacterium]
MTQPFAPTERQARVIWLALTGLAVAMLVALVAALIWGLARVLDILSPVLWPLAVAGVLAYLLDPVVDFIERKVPSRPRAILCVFGLVFLMVGGVAACVGPPILSETRQLAARIPVYASRLEQRVVDWANHPPPLIRRLLEKENARTNVLLTPTNDPAQARSPNAGPSITAATNNPPSLSNALNRENLETATGWLATALPKVGTWLLGQLGRVASWLGILVGGALVPVYTFYFLLEKRAISSRWTDYLPVADSRFKNELVFVLNSINNYLIAFFRGQVLVAMIDGVLYGVGFLIVGIPYALLLGATAMVLTMIPFLGAMVVCLSALLIALVQFGDWLHPLLVLVVFGFVQLLEGLVISPRIMGGRVGLPPVMIIIAVMAGTTLLGGLLGGILAIPLTAALRVVMFRYVWKKEEAR